MAADIFVGFETEGNHRNETEREPFPALVDARTEVAAVLALSGDILVAFEERGEICDRESVSELDVASFRATYCGCHR